MLKLTGLFPWLLLSQGHAVSAFATPHRDRTRRRTVAVAAAAALPQISPADLDALSSEGYVVVPDFLPRSLVNELRRDVADLRAAGAFRVARIGQDGTNALNTDVRVAETCFLGRDRPELATLASPRDRPGGLYDTLDGLREALQPGNGGTRLDAALTELLYAYYPQGGYYRRHRDAVPNSASTLRVYSLLLYLNEEGWDPVADAGQLRLHFDGGGDECVGEPRYMDVEPHGGTLVLFKSEMVPHEVLDTQSERFAVVGWFNRGVSAGDVLNLGESSGNLTRIGLLVVAMALVTFGVMSIIGQ